ncbi:hypothetical protein N7532_007294 [Penicillium argentinense]|uniref:Uncharacterized protein n=1 Tax=Penicillium argentinense TaxID=1131581 RepID=A0A9W9F7H3_9EURO|nr:uncharacterized protein N7532_007294 [Penicillium argentinense]KAJ5095003.1 hypothetical protein N7532_007294 [Penicillium argentinense]
MPRLAACCRGSSNDDGCFPGAPDSSLSRRPLHISPVDPFRDGASSGRMWCNATSLRYALLAPAVDALPERGAWTGVLDPVL